MPIEDGRDPRKILRLWPHTYAKLRCAGRLTEADLSVHALPCPRVVATGHVWIGAKATESDSGSHRAIVRVRMTHRSRKKILPMVTQVRSGLVASKAV